MIVLVMVDVVIGGKIGVNIFVGKNFVGVFYEFIGVLCDMELLMILLV